jgi:hypothetical protein
MALIAQRQFWNTLLRDAVPFKDLLVSNMLAASRPAACADLIWQRCVLTGGLS